jgi:hypothetical protein
LKPGSFKVWVNLIQLAPPHLARAPDVGRDLVAVPAAKRCKLTHLKATFETRFFHFIGSRVETRRLSNYGSNWMLDLYSPTARVLAESLHVAHLPRRPVAAQSIGVDVKLQIKIRLFVE